MKNNPFNIYFGEEPINCIEREKEFHEVVDVFESDNPETKAMIITGPRGCGKTVLLTQIKTYFQDKNDWLTVALNHSSIMLEQLAGKLYEEGKIKKLFLKAEFNFSFQGLSFSIKGEKPISNVHSLLDVIFKYLKKKNVKVLIVIDDVGNNDFMRERSMLGSPHFSVSAISRNPDSGYMYPARI